VEEKKDKEYNIREGEEEFEEGNLDLNPMVRDLDEPLLSEEVPEVPDEKKVPEDWNEL